MARHQVRLQRLAVPLALAGLLVGASSVGNLGAALAATPLGTGGYSCPGSLGGRSLAGPTNVGIPGVWVQGNASNNFLVYCDYPGPSISWTVEVAWTPAESGTPTFLGCGRAPVNPAATWVSRDHWAYVGTNFDHPPAALASAAKKALTTVEKLAAPCVSPTPSSSVPPTSAPAPTSAAPTGKPLCEEAIRYFADKLSAAGVSDPNNTGLRTSRDELLAGFASVIVAYNAAHQDARAHSPVSSASATMGAINWLWEVGGLNSKIWGIRKVVGNVPTEGYVTHTEPRLAQKISSSTHPLSPAEVFSIALDLNKGDVTNALLAAHNTLRALGRGDMVDQELIGVSRAEPSLYGTHLAVLRSGGEDSGPWYHLFGTAYFELLSTETGKGAEAAQALAFGADGTPAAASEVGTAVATAADHFAGRLPVTSSLSDFANWLEQKIRARHGSKPDAEKYCMNVWGAQLGAALAQAMGGTATYLSTFAEDMSDREIYVFMSPFSMRWTTPQGTTTIDQKTGAVSFGSPLLVYPLAEGSSWGAAIVPPANTTGTVTFVATTPGAELHFLRITTASAKAVLYQATAVSAGEEITLALDDAAFGQAMTRSDGTTIAAERLTLTTPSPSAQRSGSGDATASGPGDTLANRSGDASASGSGDTASMALKLAGALAGILVLGVGGAVLFIRRRRRRA